VREQPVAAKAASTAAPIQAAAPAQAPSILAKILGLKENQAIRVQDLVDPMKNFLKTDGVMIVTSDGLPVVGALPPALDMNVISRISPLLVRKLSNGANGPDLGKNTRSIMNLGSSWVSVYAESGVSLVLTHPMERIGPELDEKSNTLIREIARHYFQQTPK
jgi:hypothetical protein